MIYIGVDPGAKGGYAYIVDDVVKAFPWDDMSFALDMNCIKNYRTDWIIAAVEKVGARPGQGTVSMFNFGKNAGYIEGVLSALGIPYQLVSPRKWKAEFGLDGSKQKSIEVCRRLFPEIDLKRTERCRTDSDGKAEALLIAEWARRKM